MWVAKVARTIEVSQDSPQKMSLDEILDLTAQHVMCYQFIKIFPNTSAVSSTDLGSVIIFASCVIHRLLVFTDVLSFECI